MQPLCHLHKLLSNQNPKSVAAKDGCYYNLITSSSLFSTSKPASRKCHKETFGSGKIEMIIR